MIAYHSPPAVPSPLLLEASWVLPAAAEAKLEGSGVGIVENNWLTDEGKSPVQRRRGSQVRTKVDRVRGLVLSVLVADWES